MNWQKLAILIHTLSLEAIRWYKLVAMDDDTDEYKARKAASACIDPDRPEQHPSEVTVE